VTTPEIRIYGPAMAPFVEKLTLALALKKLAYELVEPEGPEDYRRWNPETGLLPVADIEGRRVADSARILDILDERFPEPPLVSSDPRAAASQRRLEEWAGETFFFYWVSYLRGRFEGEEAPAPSSPPRQGALARLGILRRVVEGTSEPERTDADRWAEEFGRRLDDLAGFLGNRPYFYADRISRADLAVHAFLCTLTRREIPGSGSLLDSQPSLLALMQRVEQETAAGV
jgi:glutathione S-transferase